MSEFPVGGMGLGITEIELDGVERQSVMIGNRDRLASSLGIHPELAKFIDQYQQEKLELHGPVYAGRTREACAVAVVNFLGLPDIMGKMPYMDLRERVVQKFLVKELEEATRDEGHAENLYERRMGELYQLTVIALKPDELTAYNDGLEVYFDGMETKSQSGRRAVGMLAIAGSKRFIG